MFRNDLMLFITGEERDVARRFEKYLDADHPNDITTRDTLAATMLSVEEASCSLASVRTSSASTTATSPTRCWTIRTKTSGRLGANAYEASGDESSESRSRL